MKSTRAAFPALAMALSFAIGLAPSASANPIQATYTTLGLVGEAALDGTPSVPGTGATGITGMPVISFQGINNGTLTSGQTFDLGQFMVSSLPAGTSTTYTNVPYEIAFYENTLNGTNPSPNETPIVMHGFLNGTIIGGSTPQFSSTIDPVLFSSANGPSFPTTTALFRTGGLLNGIDVTASGSNGQMIQGILNTEQAVPEPGTLAIFAVAAAYAARRWAGARKAGAPID